MAQLLELYNAACDMFIRPQRMQYPVEALGPRCFMRGGRKYVREDLELRNARGLALQCSHFYPQGARERAMVAQGVDSLSVRQLKHLLARARVGTADLLEKAELVARVRQAYHLDGIAADAREGGRAPCVVYLHGNCGCRMDALDTLPLLLSMGFSLFCLDLSGSGLSEGEYISLGHYEQQDVAAVVEYLRACAFVSSIALWGRSMGGATSLLYTAAHPEDIACLVLDSPFSSLEVLAQEVVGSMDLSVPSWLLNGALSVAMTFVRKSIRQKAEFELYDVTPIDHVHECTAPAIFVHGESDTFVKPSHSLRLCEAYGNRKTREIVLVRGDHNTARPIAAQECIANHLWRNLLPDDAKTGLLEKGPMPPFGRTEATKGLPCFLAKQVRGFDENSTWPSNAVLVFTEMSIRIVELYTEVVTHEFRYGRVAEVYTLDGDAFVFKVPGHVDLDMAQEGNQSGLICFLLADGALEAIRAFKEIAKASL
eukprot:CAMPEP_0114628432 /NCGR_PEP_ID=MMETSP0168-20121206/12818_1 /TAXON_ID=95228 ORGANISM="Vannella sp., Strain DIVA3 517/6/12" /NCGR_SAMPLE_ID=MMETSP0168 /ASSEMBLY_ACC=CAM_ASM_000044 /LENGTH=482 /DNA_ID=CAMNT_0001839815 /DNA_START=63 /DNA_END=1508 /DNA_ORIENTATION=-